MQAFQRKGWSPVFVFHQGFLLGFSCECSVMRSRLASRPLQHSRLCLPTRLQSSRPEMLPDVQALRQTLEALIIKMTQYDEESLNVSGTKRLLRRMQKEAEIVDQLAQQGEAASIVRISGAVNNVRGLQGELATAQQVPGVIALGRRFTDRVAPGVRQHCLTSRSTKCQSSCHACKAMPGLQDRLQQFRCPGSPAAPQSLCEHRRGSRS